MRSPVRAGAAAGLGSFLIAGAALAAVEHAPTPAVVFGVAGILHVALGAGLAAGSRVAAIAGLAVGLADLVLVATGMTFIVGIELGIGVDLGAPWFAPLNGYATIAVAITIATIASGLVAAGISAARAAIVVPAPRG